VRHLHGRMGRVERHVAEEGAVAVLLYERQGMAGQVVGEVTLAADFFAVVLQRRAEGVAPVPGGKAVELVAGAGVGVVGVLGAVVPLPEEGRGVTGGLERVADRFLVEVEALTARRHVPDAAARMVAAGEELGPRRRTNRTDVELL